MSGFRTRLLVAMMVVVCAFTGLALWLSNHNLAASIADELQHDFDTELAALHNAQEIRHAVLVERCRTLVGKSRIHAALEDDALDLLYPSAEDEVGDILSPTGGAAPADGAALRPQFYRFLDRRGAVISAPAGAAVGALPTAAERGVSLPSLNHDQQVGYLLDPAGRGDAVEVISTPIVSTETGDVIAALVIGFPSAPLSSGRQMRSGIWSAGRLWFPGLTPGFAREVAAAMTAATTGAEQGRRQIELEGAPHLLFFQRLNPGSRYAPAFEISLYPLDQFAARATRMRFRILAASALLLAIAFFTSHVLAGRLAAPVERLAVESERSARFSADASHQLKTPVTVLRAGLEELLARENLTPDECDEISALIHQTYRLSSLIEDLLLLARMDSGRLRLSLGRVDLAHLIAAAVDDLTAVPEDASLNIEVDVPPALGVSGESRYTAMILHNLLENARKYNRPGGTIRVAARREGDKVRLTVSNTGRGIPASAQAHIFERFHRGAVGEDVAGYGLGLNLARELARLHEGDLRLVRSDERWTEFEVVFRAAQPDLVAS